jgi:NAD(P)H-nitrite reductase large subunit
VNFVSMQDLDACEQLAPTTREAVVVGGGLIGIELVECLLHHGIKTRFLVREPWYWPVALCKEEGEMVTEHMRHHGVEVRHGEELAAVEADASGRVSAVATKKGERIGCQMLGVCIGVEPQKAFLEGAKTPPRAGRGIAVDEYLRTSLEGVWSAGDCAEVHFGNAHPQRWPFREGTEPPADGRPLIEQIWYSAKRQGELAARNMTGHPAPYRPPTFYNSAKFFDVEYTTVGDLLNLPSGTRGLFRKHPRRAVSQRVLHHEGRVVGFNMLGSRWNHELLTAWIEQERELDWVLEHLRDAQFDVEFGRADLAAMVEQDLAVTTRPRRGGDNGNGNGGGGAQATGSGVAAGSAGGV